MKRILVTGAGTGIGRACAKRLAKDGFEVVLHCNKSLEKAQEALQEIEAAGGKGSVLQFDVTDRAAARSVLEKELEDHGFFWGLVLNAGMNADESLAMMSDDEWDSVLNTNISGFYNVVKPCLTPLITAHKGGRIVAMSSVSAIAGNRGQANYAASKAAVTAAVQSLAVELARRGITCNAVAPGLIDTSMARLEPAIMSKIVDAIPMRRIGKPEEVAAAVSFLMSDGASYITRQVISVNGGMI